MWIPSETFVQMEPQLTLMVLILLVITTLIFYGFFLWMVARKYTHLPGNLGSSFPVIGNLYYFLRNSFLSQDDVLALIERLLPDGVLWLYCRPVVAISDPIIVELTCSKTFPINESVMNMVPETCRTSAFVDKEPLVYENVTNLWKGTFTYAYSDTRWKKRRKIINHSLKRQNLDEYHNTFVKMSRRMIGQMKHETGPFNVQRYMMMATLDSICETHLGYDLNLTDNNELYNLMHWVMENISKTFVNPFFGFFFNIFLAISNIIKPGNEILEMCVKKTLDNHQTTIEGMNTYLYLEAMLLQYHSVETNIQEIKKELMELVLVGSHTVGLTVCTTLIFLAALPEIQEKVLQEQQNIFGDSDRDPTILDVKRMDYLERVIKEVLRFISGPILTRKTKADIIIDGKFIPKETTVLVCSWLMRMDNHYWENPLKFDPDRHLRQEPSKNYKNSFSVFGYGIRNCPGFQYFFNEGKVFLATILRNFKVISDRRFNDI